MQLDFNDEKQWPFNQSAKMLKFIITWLAIGCVSAIWNKLTEGLQLMFSWNRLSNSVVEKSGTWNLCILIHDL